jgi:hypothetical protein
MALLGNLPVAPGGWTWVVDPTPPGSLPVRPYGQTGGSLGTGKPGGG